MPTKDVLELPEEVLVHRSLNPGPPLMATARDHAPSVKRALDSGVIHVIVEPFSQEIFGEESGERSKC